MTLSKWRLSVLTILFINLEMLQSLANGSLL